MLSTFFQKNKLALVKALYLFTLSLPSIFIASDGFNKAIYGSLILLALLNNARLFFWLLAPFFVLSHVALYYALFYKLPTDISFWFLIFGTSSAEVIEFITKANKPFMVVFYSLYITVGVICYRNMTGKFFENSRSLWRFSLMALILIPLSYAPRNENFRDYSLDIYRHFRKAYPQNLVLGYMAAKMEVNKLQELIHQPPNFNPTIEPSLRHQSATYVFVLGESARRDHLALYGYPDNTTPLMATQKDLLTFKDMVSYGYNTSTSIPYTLTKTNDNQVSPSFLSVFKQAGFKVFWLSNQAQYGQFDSLISAYASVADVTHFMSTHSYSMSAPENYDEKLLPYYEKALADKAEKKLIILHLYGSHADFGKRYPPAMNIFSSTYDNSIYYTDSILKAVINKLASNKMAAMFYLSDHGLNLGECVGAEGHIDAKTSYEVPFLMWLNPSWQKNNAEKYQNLLHRQNSPVHTGDIFDSLTDIAGVHYRSQDLSHSVASANYQYHPRMVKAAQSELDYDQSVTGEGCHLQPMPQK